MNGPDASGIVSRAGGSATDPVSAPPAVLTYGDASFFQQLRHAGAWMLRNATEFTAFCR